LRERQTERAQAGGAGRGREEANSPRSGEPSGGLNLMTPRSQPEPKPGVRCSIDMSHPGNPQTHFEKYKSLYKCKAIVIVTLLL